jgi:hypothetical protein
VLPVIILGVLLALAVATAAALVRAARNVAVISLADDLADAGELLCIDPGGEDEARVVVRRVMTDLTASHVVLVRPYRRWHRWKVTRRWL